MICARCGEHFSPNKGYESLCSDCYLAALPYGDVVSAKMWRGVSLLINTGFSMHDLSELADSVAFCRFVKEVLKEKDLDTKILYLKELVREAQS